jgi:ribosomal protein S16
MTNRSTAEPNVVAQGCRFWSQLLLLRPPAEHTSAAKMQSAVMGNVRPFQVARVAGGRPTRVAMTVEARVTLRFQRFGRKKSPFYRWGPRLRCSAACGPLRVEDLVARPHAPPPLPIPCTPRTAPAGWWRLTARSAATGCRWRTWGEAVGETGAGGRSVAEQQERVPAAPGRRCVRGWAVAAQVWRAPAVAAPGQLANRAAFRARRAATRRWYDPLKKETNLKAPEIKKWLANGAQPSETVKNLLKKAYVMEPDAPKVKVPKVTL